MEDKIICLKCRELLVKKTVQLEYLGTKVTNEFPVCPSCGAVYIPPETAEGKMRDVEETLEDK